MQITMEEYGQSLESLISLAQGDSVASKAAAQVVLSIYNGFNWHVDLTDLCELDSNYFQDAIAVIRGRIQLHTEPQHMIGDGSQVFGRLCRKWGSELRTDTRYQHYARL